MKPVLIFFLVLFSYNATGQSDTLSSEPDTSFVYYRSLRYVGSSTHIDGNYIYVMEELVDYLQKHPEYTIHIRGHVCCGPAYKVSKKRAKNVYKFLKRAGINKERMSFKGYSDSMPAAWPEKTEEDEAMNRRVDFVICPNK